MVIERSGNFLQILPNGFGGIFQKAGSMLINLAAPSPNAAQNPVAADVYVAPPLSAAHIDGSQLRGKLAYLQKQSVVAEKNVEQVHGAYFAALGGAALSISVIAFAVACLCSVPWALLGAPLLALSTYFVPQAFTHEKAQRKLKQECELARDVLEGKIQWHEEKLRLLAEYEAAHPVAIPTPPPTPTSPSTSSELDAPQGHNVAKAWPGNTDDFLHTVSRNAVSSWAQGASVVTAQSQRLTALPIGALQTWLSGASALRDFLQAPGDEASSQNIEPHVVFYGETEGYTFSVPTETKGHRD